MGRPKEFDRDCALKKAIKLFADHGFEGTSTDSLMRAMGISRQSMYDTFGGKRKLYLEALQRYNADSVSNIIRDLNTGGSPLRGLEAALLAFSIKPPKGSPRFCLGISAICEFGRSDHEISVVTEAAGRIVLSAFESLIAEAKRVGEVGAQIDTHTAAHFMLVTVSGMKVAARGGAAPETLRKIALMAIRSLR